MRLFLSVAVIVILSGMCLCVQAAVGVGDKAPSLGSTSSYNTAKGGPVELHALKGKVVLIDFWATWCGPCVDAIPHMQELHEKYESKGLVVIGHTDSSSRGLPAFIKEKGITYRMSVGEDIGTAYGVSGIPAVFLCDTTGKVLWAGHPMSMREDILVEALKEVVLNAPSVPTFEKISSNKSLAKIQKSMTKGKVGKGIISLEKSIAKKSADVEAAAILEEVLSWKVSIDEELATAITAGDIYNAYNQASQMADVMSGHDSAKVYKKQAAELKKEDAYKAGKDFLKVESIALQYRSSPKFTAMVEKFIKKHAGTYYAEKAKELLP